LLVSRTITVIPFPPTFPGLRLHSLLSLLPLLPLATALTLQVPTNPTVGETVTISWTSDSSDPSTWSLFLSNPSFRDDLGLQATVQGSSGSTTIEIPDVAPG
jgi:hypothetical protein